MFVGDRLTCSSAGTVQRITAETDDPQRSRLSIMAQVYTNVRVAQKLPRSVFVPEPEVDAGALIFEPRETPMTNIPFHVLESVVRSAFQERRKYIKSSLACVTRSDVLLGL
jgi:16S rRNA (adenine1518-N6/adenine1519-N6)-dimethyltransferase